MRWYRIFAWMPILNKRLFPYKVAILKVRGDSVVFLRDYGRIVAAEKQGDMRSYEVDLLFDKELAPLPTYDYIQGDEIKYLNTAKGVYIPVKLKINPNKEEVLITAADLATSKGYYIQQARRNADDIIKKSWWDKWQGPVMVGVLAMLFIIGLIMTTQNQVRLAGMVNGAVDQLSKAIDILSQMLGKFQQTTTPPPP